MTLAIRTPARLLAAASDATLAEGVAVIWADPAGWGGVFEAQGPAEALRESVAGGPLAARLRTHDGRHAPVTLGLSAFTADGARPLVFSGVGPIDSAAFRACAAAPARSEP
jgi:hypothetical protein